MTIEPLAADLTDSELLDEACRVLGGATAWRTYPGPSFGIPVVKMSDGPNGVRAEQSVNGSTPGVAIPVGIALGATWDPALVERLGELLGEESVRRGAHVLLAPTVNIIRLPIGGRAFECYSEDPELTARLAVGFVRGVQSKGVAATIKHFVANDTEVDRMTVSAEVDPAVLREVYLRPFEAAVTEANVWAIMSAYNRLGGEFCAHHQWLLTDLLRDEWGFDGAVISDWGGSHDTVGSITGGLTIAMPGPRTVYGEPLAAAVRNGAVPAELVAARLDDVARLAERTRAATLTADREQRSVDDAAERALCRDAATGGMVLVRNNGALPLAAGQRVAVIGPNSADTRIMGGGSSSLRPLPWSTILEALQERLGDDFVGHAVGTSIDKMPPPLDLTSLRTPDGRPGLLMELRNGRVVDDQSGPVLNTGLAESTQFWMGVDNVPELSQDFTVTLTGSFVPAATGPHTISAVIAGGGRVVIGGVTVLDDPQRKLPRSDHFFGFASIEQSAVIDCVAGVEVPVSIITTGRSGAAAVRVGVTAEVAGDQMEQAVALAASADVAVVVVGTNDEWETEGIDRTSLALPGRQDELVRRVAAACPRTVVVINSGAPVALPWLDNVDAVVNAGFAGIETGPAVAAVLVGDVDPGGRLPVSYPVHLEDSPAWPHYRPVDGQQIYAEGRGVGYRGFATSAAAPAVPFGHGLSYGTTEWHDISASVDRVAADGSVVVSVRIDNTGERAATDVVQVYVTDPRPEIPIKLAGFAKVRTEGGQSATATVELGSVAWRRWDVDANAWVVDDGPRDVIVARSSADVAATLAVQVDGGRL